MVNNYVSIFYQPRFGSTICLVTVMALVIALNAVGTMPRTKAPNSGSYTMPDVYLVEVNRILLENIASAVVH